jgi:phosphatidate cytidylyltransferase
MKTRILAAVVLIPVLLLIVLVAPKWVATIVFALMLAVAAYELLFRTGLVRHPRLVIYACMMAVAVTVWSFFDAVHAYAVLGIMVFVIILFMETMLDHVKVDFELICVTLMAGLVVPYLLSSMVRILAMKIGKYMVLVPFLIAFSSDAGAYFAGKFYGKHKLAPVVSPNKTIEGALGGLLCAVLGMMIYAAILDLGFRFRVNYLFAAIYGLGGAMVGVIGDLCFSAIKRQTGIKDYGNLIPGHGGVLDRFDSLMTVGPLIEVLLVLIPFAVG